LGDYDLAVVPPVRRRVGRVCIGRRTAYALSTVKPPFVNVEEEIDRFVGRRMATPDALSTATSSKAESIAWRKALGGTSVPRGVHRFKTLEEADEWLWRMIARPKN
jgi:hypothetical protein